MLWMSLLLLMSHSCTRSFLSSCYLLPSAVTAALAATVGNLTVHSLHSLVNSFSEVRAFSQSWISVTAHQTGHERTLVSSFPHMLHVAEKMPVLWRHGKLPMGHTVPQTPISVQQWPSHASPCSLLYGVMVPKGELYHHVARTANKPQQNTTTFYTQ